MIGIDTNILVRYLTQDDIEQAKVVEQLFNKYATGSHSVFINNIVICELIWVLERGYKYSKEDITKVIKHILSTKEFNFENQELLWLSLNQYSQKKLDFSDALIGEINKHSGCTNTLTFDKAAITADNFIFAAAPLID
jgi:predicted nucleic-acid-binding protein